MKLNRLSYKKEPVLHIHNYVCAIITSNNEVYDVAYKYKINLREVLAVKNSLKPGQILEVYRSTHNFIKAWERPLLNKVKQQGHKDISQDV